MRDGKIQIRWAKRRGLDVGKWIDFGGTNRCPEGCLWVGYSLSRVVAEKKQFEREDREDGPGVFEYRVV